ncbi:MAG: hypothetical protein KW788_04415 [Candidatus Doudnabacteria bacterium]|nr:hypothetical protein [Candidatus Doudnabacteria bacterium]
MARVVDPKPSPSVEKQIDCPGCGARIAYVGNDVKRSEGRDISGGPDGREWVTCPGCYQAITIRQW